MKVILLAVAEVSQEEDWLYIYIYFLIQLYTVFTAVRFVAQRVREYHNYKVLYVLDMCNW